MMSMTASTTANYTSTITGNEDGDDTVQVSMVKAFQQQRATMTTRLPMSGMPITAPMASAHTTTVYGDYTDGNDPGMVQIYE